MPATHQGQQVRFIHIRILGDVTGRGGRRGYKENPAEHEQRRGKPWWRNNDLSSGTTGHLRFVPAQELWAATEQKRHPRSEPRHHTRKHLVQLRVPGKCSGTHPVSSTPSASGESGLGPSDASAVERRLVASAKAKARAIRIFCSARSRSVWPRRVFVKFPLVQRIGVAGRVTDAGLSRRPNILRQTNPNGWFRVGDAFGAGVQSDKAQTQLGN